MTLNYIIKIPQIILSSSVALYSYGIVGKPKVCPIGTMLPGSVDFNRFAFRENFSLIM